MKPKLNLVKSSYKAEGEETYHGMIQHSETLTQEDLLDEMEWHHSTLTKTNMRAVSRKPRKNDYPCSAARQAGCHQFGSL